MLSNHDYNFWLTIGIMAAFAVALVLWVFVMAAFEQNRRKDTPGNRHHVIVDLHTKKED